MIEVNTYHHVFVLLVIFFEEFLNVVHYNFEIFLIFEAEFEKVEYVYRNLHVLNVTVQVSVCLVIGDKLQNFLGGVFELRFYLFSVVKINVDQSKIKHRDLCELGVFGFLVGFLEFFRIKERFVYVVEI